MANENFKDFFEAKADFYRDLTTVLSFIVGSSLVVLTIGGGTADVSRTDFVGLSHPYAFWFAIGVGITFLICLGKMIQYDQAKVRIAKRPPKQK